MAAEKTELVVCPHRSPSTNECLFAKDSIGAPLPAGARRVGKADLPFDPNRPMYECRAGIGLQGRPMEESQRNQLLAEGQQGCQERLLLRHITFR